MFVNQREREYPRVRAPREKRLGSEVNIWSLCCNDALILAPIRIILSGRKQHTSSNRAIPCAEQLSHFISTKDFRSEIQYTIRIHKYPLFIRPSSQSTYPGIDTSISPYMNTSLSISLASRSPHLLVPQQHAQLHSAESCRAAATGVT